MNIRGVPIMANTIDIIEIMLKAFLFVKLKMYVGVGANRNNMRSGFPRNSPTIMGNENTIAIIPI